MILKGKIRATCRTARKESRSIFWNPLKRTKYSIECMTKQLNMFLIMFRNTDIKRLIFIFAFQLGQLLITTMCQKGIMSEKLSNQYAYRLSSRFCFEIQKQDRENCRGYDLSIPETFQCICTGRFKHSSAFSFLPLRPEEFGGLSF